MPPLIDRETMERHFEPSDMVTLDEAQLAGVTHAETRSFLRDVGLPHQENKWFYLDLGFSGGSVRLGDVHPEIADAFDNLPPTAADWISLGDIPYDGIAVDGETGIVYCLPDDGAEIYPLNASIHAFAHFLCLLEEERKNYDFGAVEEFIDTTGAAARLLSRMQESDPTSVGDEDSTWRRMLEYVEEGIPA
ncbi:SUKH-4 family immunity protein [Streptomyces sp. SDT5-1]|uniref:SUKH-4 family immunity protein n=1 Tax=Streptomyces sp. SDT5-1 TaxID=3406418 RepID=UPI003FD449C4